MERRVFLKEFWRLAKTGTSILVLSQLQKSFKTGVTTAEALKRVYFPLVTESEKTRGYEIFFARPDDRGNYAIYYHGKKVELVVDDVGGQVWVDWEPSGIKTPDGLNLVWSRMKAGIGSQIWWKDSQGNFSHLSEGLRRHCYESDVGFPDRETSILDVVNGAVIEHDFTAITSAVKQESMPLPLSIFGNPEEQSNNPSFLSIAVPDNPSLARYFSAVVKWQGERTLLIVDRLTGLFYQPRLEDGLEPYNAVHAWNNSGIYFVGTQNGKREIWAYEPHWDIVSKAIKGDDLMDPGRIVSLPPNKTVEEAIVLTVTADDWDEGTLALIPLNGIGNGELQRRVLPLSPGLRRSPRFALSTEAVLHRQKTGQLRSIGQSEQWSREPLPGFQTLPVVKEQFNSAYPEP